MSKHHWFGLVICTHTYCSCGTMSVILRKCKEIDQWPAIILTTGYCSIHTLHSHIMWHHMMSCDTPGIHTRLVMLKVCNHFKGNTNRTIRCHGVKDPHLVKLYQWIKIVSNERQARESYMVKREEGIEEQQLTGSEPATSGSIADHLAAEPLHYQHPLIPLRCTASPLAE